MGDSYIVFGRPHFEEDEIQAVSEVLRGGWAGTGPRAAEFERQFARYIGCKHAVSLNSCSAALHLGLLSLGIGPGDEVITTPLTFAATAHAIVHVGARPVFADVDPDSMNIAPAEIERRLGPRTRALLPVHFAGRPCEMEAIRAIAAREGLAVLDDAAHAVETWYRGRKVGTLTDASCFSFYVNKNLTTVEGGMLCTDRDDIADCARSLRLQGMTADAWGRFSDDGYRHYDVPLAGFKYNMTDLNAAIGLVQLRKLKQQHERRQQVWKRYDAAFAGLPCGLPAPAERDTVHARHLYTLQIDPLTCGIGRDAFMAALHRRGIGTGVHYRALHTLGYYQRTLGLRPDELPNAWRIGQQTVSLPLQASLTDAEVERVVAAVRDVLHP
jgi:dTDP-4-amino-4,6-dideoxygalactose transaminase